MLSERTLSRNQLFTAAVQSPSKFNFVRISSRIIKCTTENRRRIDENTPKDEPIFATGAKIVIRKGVFQAIA